MTDSDAEKKRRGLRRGQRQDVNYCEVSDSSDSRASARRHKVQLLRRQRKEHLSSDFSEGGSQCCPLWLLSACLGFYQLSSFSARPQLFSLCVWNHHGSRVFLAPPSILHVLLAFADVPACCCCHESFMMLIGPEPLRTRLSDSILSLDGITPIRL